MEDDLNQEHDHDQQYFGRCSKCAAVLLQSADNGFDVHKLTQVILSYDAVLDKRRGTDRGRRQLGDLGLCAGCGESVLGSAGSIHAGGGKQWVCHSDCIGEAMRKTKETDDVT